MVGRQDLYYGGTTYDNHQGVGVQLAPLGLDASQPRTEGEVAKAQPSGLLLAPVTRLLDRGALVTPSELLASRLAKLGLSLHPETALKLGLAEGQEVQLALGGGKYSLPVTLDETLPLGVGLLPRSCGAPAWGPVVIKEEAFAKREPI